LAAEDIDPLQIEDPSRWRNVRLEMIKEDGSLLKITLLRPLDWLDVYEATIGSIIELDLEELGAAGPAEVVAIEPCPEIEPGEMPLITGTFEHLAANVVDLQVESEAEPIGTTDNHPFWSEDRQEFVAAGELKIGEFLRLADGQTTRVTSIVPRAGPEAVYNLEISGQHVYNVGDSGVLVHNTYIKYSQKGYAIEYLPNSSNTGFVWKINRRTSSANNSLVKVQRNGRHVWVREHPDSVEIHHIIPFENSTYNHQNHKLVKLANVDIKSHAANLVKVKGHKGPHSDSYHKAIDQRMTQAMNKYQPKDAAEARIVLDKVLSNAIDDIHTGSLRLYDHKNVSIVP
jgi:hypothetical protein